MLAGLILLASCAKEEALPTLPVRTLSVEEAQVLFTKTLSAAVSNNEGLRLFIKKKAQEQFDCDYDVFYPFVKDVTVADGQSFREILLDYCSEEDLCAIERALPKLNILVPDWAWLGCFSVNEWDAHDAKIAVSYVSGDGSVGVYSNGEELGILPHGSLPGFPVLIVKSNERMVYTPSTKGSEGSYDFVCEEFNNVQTKVVHEYFKPEIDGTPDTTCFVPATEINYRVKQAYNYFPAGPRSIYQRDYLYYNMTEENQEKPLYDNIREKIYKIKFNKFDNEYFFDDVINGSYHDFDGRPLDGTWDYKKNNGWASADDLRNHFYAQGNLELIILITMPTDSAASTLQYCEKSISFEDAFAISYANLDFRHKTAFCKDWYVYTIEDKAILPKWYVVNYELPVWDISHHATAINFMAMEIDETGNYEVEYTAETTFATNFKTEVSEELGTNAKVKIGLGYTSSNSSKGSVKEKYTRTQGGVDLLGSCVLEYKSPVLVRTDSKDGVSGYNVYTISTGSVDIMLLPFSY